MKIALLFNGALLAWLGGSTMFAATEKSRVLPSRKQQITAEPFQALAIHGSRNVFRLSEKLITGSQPEGDIAFKALAALGVKTIITVDGAKPDIENAKKYGLRYVQIPFGYSGVPQDKSLSLVRAVRELPGQIYLHCHHGRHRSPVAAACVVMANNGWSNDKALSFLKRAGTGANYTGLWDGVRHYQRPSDEEIKKASDDFPAIARTTSLVQTMVRLEELVEHLQATKKANWKKTANHPDLDPPHEALMLREMYAELRREEATRKRPQDFQNWLSEGEKQSWNLENALRAGETMKADAAFQKITANCHTCHAVYRNVPLKSKNK